MTTRIRPDSAGIAAMAAAPEMGQAMVALAVDAVAQARPTLPRRTGSYADGIQVVPAMVRAGRKREIRAGAMVTATAPHSAGVEWRNQTHALARIAALIDGRKHKGAGTSPRRLRPSARRRTRRTR